MEKEIKRIITHCAPHHIDEVLAVSLLLSRWPEAEVEKVKNLEEVKVDESTVVVDIGGKFDPPQYLDHHQNTDISSSFVLVLKHFFGIDLEPENAFEDYNYLDKKDRLGPKAVESLSRIQHPMERVLCKLFENVNKHKSVFIEVGKFVLGEIQKRKEDVKILEKHPPKKDGVGYLIEIDRPNLTLYSILNPNAVGVITKNPRGGYSITRLIGVEPKKFDPQRYAEEKGWKITFRHPTGFMVVVEDIKGGD